MRINAKWYEVRDVLEESGMGVIQVMRFTSHVGSRVMRGWRLILPRQMTEGEHEEVLSYPNVGVGSCYSRNAPETVYQTVAVYNRRIV